VFIPYAGNQYLHYRIRFKILVDLVRVGAVSAQRLSNFFHLFQQLLHVVLHVLQNQPEAAISLGLPYGQDMSVPRMAHFDLAILLAQFFARLRHGLARHYGIPYVPCGQCGALNVNYGHYSKPYRR
jgi:hypothetical protein